MRWLGVVGEEEDEVVVVVARGGGCGCTRWWGGDMHRLANRCYKCVVEEWLAGRQSCWRSCVSPQLVKVVGSSRHKQIDAEIRKFGSVKNDVKVFTYAQLVEATNNFNSESLIDEGGFRNVYKGYIKSVEQTVVVKVLTGMKHKEHENFLQKFRNYFKNIN
ncbi:hypothetical protein DEO72_LG5g1995 [Vigna unguiculata]|uniref:Uncharacterized protein n=1 Tax=Vigna unguiculata TaxID=3917 RepID=A0A4D6M000_VIGUN|nr:hypothetical protein DEO72_LG5g1995 [Vigna unguiculata]